MCLFKVMAESQQMTEENVCETDNERCSENEAARSEVNEVHERSSWIYTFCGSFASIILPYYMVIKQSCPFADRMLSKAEEIVVEITSTLNENDTLLTMAWKICKALKEKYQEPLTRLATPETVLVALVSAYSKIGQSLHEIVSCVERIYNTTVPDVPGVEPWFQIQENGNLSVREKCFYMNLNLYYRLFLHGKNFLNKMMTLVLTFGDLPVVEVNSSQQAAME